MGEGLPAPSTAIKAVLCLVGRKVRALACWELLQSQLEDFSSQSSNGRDHDECWGTW